MNNKLYTDGELTELQSLPKRIVNPRARWLEKPKERPAYRQCCKFLPGMFVLFQAAHVGFVDFDRPSKQSAVLGQGKAQAMGKVPC